MKLVTKIKEKLGDFWWNSVILFFAIRFGDFVNMFIGLWLVPKLVSQDELGAVVPLTQLVAVFGTPLAILSTWFTKQINIFAIKGEVGKIKKMLRDVFLFIGVFSIMATLFAKIMIPFAFERMKIARGSLGIIIIASSMLITVSPLFGNALQALSRFKIIAITHIISAPIRLFVMLIAMPFRAISGYFVGQAAPAVLQIVMSLVGLRRIFSKDVVPLPYFDSSMRRMLSHYVLPLSVYIILSTFYGFVFSLVIQQRLPSIDSAAYYLLSRFAEIASYLGMTLFFVIFPFASESHERGIQSQRLLIQAIVASAGFGLLLSGFYALAGKWILSFVSLWREYAGYTPYLVWMTILSTLSIVWGCFVTFEIASSRFSFAAYFIPIHSVWIAILYATTGYSYFYGKIPDTYVNFLKSLNGSSLNFVLTGQSVAFAAVIICMIVQIIKRRGDFYSSEAQSNNNPA